MISSRPSGSKLRGVPPKAKAVETSKLVSNHRTDLRLSRSAQRRFAATPADRPTQGAVFFLQKTQTNPYGTPLCVPVGRCYGYDVESRRSALESVEIEGGINFENINTGTCETSQRFTNN